MNRKRNHLHKLIALVGFAYIWGCEAPGLLESTFSKPVQQVDLDRVAQMPNAPEPYQSEDWYQKARDLDAYLYDTTTSGPYQPFIWTDHAERNFPEVAYGLYTAVGDVRQGPDKNNGEAHEAICMLGSINGSTLVGIDKSNQDGRNYVSATRNYFNRANGWNIIMNFTNKSAHVGGGYGNDFWYDVFNNVLFYAVAYHYPETPGFRELQRTIADQFYKADSVMGNNYSYSYFDFGQMQPGTNHIPPQEDAAAGFAYLLYNAYIKYGDDRYLEAAKHALSVIYSQKDSRFWEILMPFGAYTAVRMNAEEGMDYDPTILLDWTFDGTATNREGWGVVNGHWGNYDAYGLVGSTIDRGGYGFLMNTFDLAWPLVPLVRYDQRYAHTVGKWLLNASNAARLCYAYNIPDSLQAVPDHKAITKNLIGYEGLIHHSTYPGLEGKTPVAQGDGPLWAPGNPPETMFSIYGSSHVGVYGAIIRATNVEKILQLNCLATDLYPKGKAYPTFLYYNPYEEAKEVMLAVGSQPVDVYDAVRRKIIISQATVSTSVTLDPDAAAVLVLIPAGAKLTQEGHRLLADGVVIDYRFGE